MVIESESIESDKIESIQSKWVLQERGDTKCHVDFQVELVVRDPVLVNVLDRVMEQVSERQVEAFQQRCHDELKGRLSSSFYTDGDRGRGGE